MSTIIELSVTAHERALKYGGAVPAERGEFDHLPMTRVGDVPVFDTTRMRVDQVRELEDRLKVLGGFVRARKVEEQVHDFMEAFGAGGVRVQEVMDDTGASKPAVLRYLRRLGDVGKVAVRDEPNPRGNGASRRKRYYWVADGGLDYGPIEEFEGLTIRSARMDSNDGPGIIHHGPMGELQGCVCGWCVGSVTDSIFLESISSARAAGGSGFAEGVTWTTERRLAEEREFARSLGLAT